MSETIRNEAVISGKVSANRRVFDKFLIPGAVILAVTALIAGLLLSGYMAVVLKRPAQKVELSTHVCGDDVVTAYNNAASYKRRDASGQDTIDEKGLKTLVTTIKSKSGYTGDPTCQMIVLMTALHNNDYTTAQQTYSAVKELHAKGLYVDSNLSTGGSLPAYELFVQQLSPSSQSNKEPKGGA